jgi:hypothetical protein
MSGIEVVIGFGLLVMFLSGGIGIMHNVFQGGTREDGTHVDETPQEAVDNGTPWALLSLAVGAVVIGLLLIL